MAGHYWTTGWACVQHAVDLRPHLGPAALRGQSIYSRLQLSLGGGTFRIALSNEFGESPLEIRAIYLWPVLETQDRWRADERREPHPASCARAAVVPVTFGGQSRVTLAAGKVFVSDPAHVDLGALGVAAVHQLLLCVELGHGLPTSLSGKLPPALQRVALEPISDQAYWLRALAETEGGTLCTSTPPLLIQRVDVSTREAAAVTILIGEPVPLLAHPSAIDAAGARWQRRLHGPRGSGVSTQPQLVIDQTLAGNRLLRPGRGPSVSARFERDALGLAGTTDVIVHAGLNDLLTADDSRADGYPWPSASTMIGAFSRLARLARSRNTRIHVTTLVAPTPMPALSRGAEETRRTLNAWLRRSPAFDSCIDLADPTNLALGPHP